MAITTFIPELWNARLLHSLDKAHVAAHLVNRDYEGEVKKMGDTVHINTIGPVTISTYTKDTDIEAPENIATADQTLTLSEAKYFNFSLDDVDSAQAAGSVMEKAMERSAYALNDIADTYILSLLADNAGTVIGEDSPVTLTAENIYENIVALRLALDKNNVPTYERSIVMPPEAYALLLQDARFTQSGGEIAENVLKNGFVGKIAGFEIYESNNCVNDEGVFSITAQVPSACTFVEQILETEAYRPESRFADAVKGLHVYGAKVTSPESVACLKCKI